MYYTGMSGEYNANLTSLLITINNINIIINIPRALYILPSIIQTFSLRQLTFATKQSVHFFPLAMKKVYLLVAAFHF